MSAARPIRFGIGARLMLAFGGVGTLAVVACVVGWFSYERLSENLGAINRTHLPAVALAARLAEHGGGIIATAPVLALARKPEEYEIAKHGLDTRLAAMRAVFEEIRRHPAGGLQGARLASSVEAIAINLAGLDASVRERLALEKRNREAIAELRWLHADLIDEAEPLVEDARFVIRSGLATAERALGSDELGELRKEIRKTEAINGLNAQTNLAVGLLNRVGTITTLDDLIQTTHFLSETADTIEQQLTALDDASDTLTLRQTVRRLLELSKPDGGIPAVRRSEILAADKTRMLLAENRGLMAALDDVIGAHVHEANRAAERAAAQSERAIAVGRRLLLGVAAASVLAAALVGLFYVRRSLVGRIRSLASSAGALARGDLATPIPLQGGDELAVMAQALKRFRDTQQELIQAAKLAALGGLSAGIGHELNQPLAAIRSHAHNCRLLLERGRYEEAGTALTRIQTLTARMADIITHLKRFARRPDAILGPVPLRSVVEAALSLFDRRFEEEGIVLEVDIADEIAVRAEEVRLEQVFVNLIGNAVDAMRGVDDSRLTISATQGDGEIEVRVADTGVGIAEAHRATIFDPFFTTKPIGSGLGLGLSMSYNIIRDFGGRLALAETSGAGTLFVITLRAAE
ncbi:ATP-binding protein [Chelatococcus sp. SYSU_G07232]|uniref:histidine kinase n=1 Tax=Chelatococcus albus TaxID=3047466 RepID=A0ABT7AE10_9HYPH|nr:ATP-binding protein [Chelatococcus sp. SYSU_G07232]MDJ1157620.1 ATP-binding protein [Chelatococcus sp. SYSU_G07232]